MHRHYCQNADQSILFQRQPATENGPSSFRSRNGVTGGGRVDMVRRSWNTFEIIVKEWAALLGEDNTVAA